MEKINRFNLDIALFNRELNEFIESVNEIDNETNNLLIETVIAVNRLQIKSKFREISSSHQNNFALNLDDEIFECRRYIVCRLCHENIPLCAEDFESHIQKKSHKEREISLKTTRKSINVSGYDSVLTTNRTSINGGSNLNHEQSTESNTNSSVDAQASCSSSEMSHSISVDSLRSVSENVCVSRKLENVIQPEIIFKAISTKIIEITTRTEDRIRSEKRIILLLTRCLGFFDSTSKIIRIGSSTYGFGGAKTNFNVIINTSQNPISALHSFEKILKASDVQMEFEAITTINCDRVQRRRLQAIHKESRILCVMHFSSNHEMAESSQVIRDAIVHTPLCFHLIAYIKCWQGALNEVAAQNGMCAFQFNTYIIAVLVIFYLQYNKKFPKLKELPASQTKFIHTLSDVSEVNVKQAIWEFFEFYGKKYEPSNQMISIQIGRWQDLQFLTRKAETMNLTPEQKSWCDGILANGSDWKNCVMYVQDIKSPGKNIAAEISKEDANNFRMMCKMFSSDINVSDKISVDYLSKLVKFEPICVDPINNSTRSSMSPLHSLEAPVASFEKLTLGQPSCSNGSSAVSMCTSPRLSKAKSLEDIIIVDEVSERIKSTTDQILSRSQERISNEQKIINMLLFYFQARHSVNALAPFGSATYGFGGRKTNLNILIVPGFSGASPTNHSLLLTIVKNDLNTSGIEQDFEFEGQINANRVHMDQLKIVHRNSRIECLVELRPESSLKRVKKTSQIIVDYMGFHPMCKPLIAYIRAWQIVLNDVATKNGLQMFQINSYVISVLVIFYLQMNHGLPVVNELPSMIASKMSFSSKHDLGHFVKDFFHFYGTTFERKTHLISVNVGKWQQINSPGQIRFSPEQKSMRDGIMHCPGNWKNCSMYVQDPISPSTNITAELTKYEVDNFIKMCKIFATYESIVDSSYVSPMSSASSACSLSSASQLSSRSSADKALPQNNQNIDVVSSIVVEMAQVRLVSFIETRQSNESEILAILRQYIHNHDSSLEIYPCGSTQYGIRFLNSNFNLLINTNGRKPKEVSQWFYFKLEKTDISKHFKQLHKINANRAICRQISMVHIKSGIQCTILFAKNKTIVESTEIISRYTRDPLCKFLITYVKIWQNNLYQADIAHFQFNTYIVSVLVIFFLQMEFGEASFPPVDRLLTTSANVQSNISDFKPVLRQFFYFYGNRYQICNHVISINIGQWQERRLQAIQNFSPAQNRLRGGIEASPENWTNCKMFVQDIVRPDINITAEIPRKAAENFQQMCQQFTNKID